ARAPRLPCDPEDDPTRGATPCECARRVLELPAPTLGGRGAAGCSRRLGLTRPPHLQERAVRGVPGRPCVRRGAPRAARSAPGIGALVRLRGCEGTRVRG